jgi:hypothetical protein
VLWSNTTPIVVTPSPTLFEMLLCCGLCLKQNGKVQVKNIHNLTPHATTFRKLGRLFKN